MTALPACPQLRTGQIVAPLAAAGFVYFFGAGPFIKIGYTTDWKDRLRVVKTSTPYPITLINVIRGDRPLERQLHERFATARANGEWFEFTEEIRNFLFSIVYQRVDTRPWRP